MKQRLLEPVVISVFQGILGCILGFISGATGAALIGLVLAIVTPTNTNGFGLLILFGGVVGIPIGCISGLLSAMTDSSLCAGWEWAIIGALAALSVISIEGFDNSELAGIMMLMAMCAIPSAVVAWFIKKHRPNTARRRYITGRSLAIYVVGILLIAVVVYNILEAIASSID